MRYEIYQVVAGVLMNQWRWRLKAGNNQIIASGESYYNRNDCLHAINLIRSTSNAPIYEI